MSSPLAARRLEIHAAARRDPAGFVRIDPASVRFHLGTSLADFAVPIRIAPDARAVFQGAAAEIALLLGTQHPFVPEDDRDRLIVHEDYARLPAVEPLYGPSTGGPDLRGAAQLASLVHPALTGGIVTAWLGRGGRGNGLVTLLIALWRRAFEEMAETGEREATPLLVALAVSAELQAAEAGLRDLLPGPPLDRYLRGAAQGALWIAVRTGLARAWRDAGRRAGDPLLLRIEAALAPGPLLGGRAGVAAGGATLYGCDLSPGIPHAEDVVARLAQGGDPEAAQSDLVQALGADDDLARRAEHAVAVSALRELLGSAIAAAEAAGDPHIEPLRTLFCAPGALGTAVAGDEERKALARDLAK
ncbi:MAG TPA: hypothetical protein VLT47_14570, partial [Anaeromyxobacteraceae bacterium]|nr:hypothetical protein [Anaeromyxobacteraceae bacterium]